MPTDQQIAELAECGRLNRQAAENHSHQPLKATGFSVTINHEHKWHYMFFDGFLASLVENGLLEPEYIEEGIRILNAVRQGGNSHAD